MTDGTPTHSWMQVVYRYPQREFPYGQLREMARNAGPGEPRARAQRHRGARREPVLRRPGHLREGRARTTSASRSARPTTGPRTRRCTCCRSCGSATRGRGGGTQRPCSAASRAPTTGRKVTAEHGNLGRYTLHLDDSPSMLMTDNESNEMSLFGAERNPSPWTKDGICNYVVHGSTSHVPGGRAGRRRCGRHEVRGLVLVRPGRAGRDGDDPAAAGRRRRAPGPVRAELRRDHAAPASSRPTSSTTTSRPTPGPSRSTCCGARSPV